MHLVIARHPRSFEQEDFIIAPLHYLPLLERKPRTRARAEPLEGWELPQEFATLRRLLEARKGNRGKREFVQTLRLLENFSLDEVHQVLKEALRLGAVGYDPVNHLLLCRIESRPPLLDLYPHLPQVSVQTTRAGDYLTLLSERSLA